MLQVILEHIKSLQYLGILVTWNGSCVDEKLDLKKALGKMEY